VPTVGRFFGQLGSACDGFSDRNFGNVEPVPSQELEFVASMLRESDPLQSSSGQFGSYRDMRLKMIKHFIFVL
jgi:hypothetical protein